MNDWSALQEQWYEYTSANVRSSGMLRSCCLLEVKEKDTRESYEYTVR
jgi:hypothetical protein